MQFSIRIEDEQKKKWEQYAQENDYDSLAELIRISVEDTIRESESEVPSQLEEVLERLDTILRLQRELDREVEEVNENLPEIDSIEAVVETSENRIIQELFEEIQRLEGSDE
ncbi:hypothetical protein [Halorubrum distributum]|uniref:hypothetical protein n=1 Tax=Halorubrum distributum TaxID=29283 RepID=UPI00067790CB|nr:hypothetical protein [Halorubrum arcis]